MRMSATAMLTMYMLVVVFMCFLVSTTTTTSRLPKIPICKQITFYSQLRRFQVAHHENEGVAQTEQRLDGGSEDESLGHLLTGISEIIV